jgi:hypothetical protein
VTTAGMSQSHPAKIQLHLFIQKLMYLIVLPVGSKKKEETYIKLTTTLLQRLVQEVNHPYNGIG